MLCSVEMQFLRDMILVGSGFTHRGLKEGGTSRQEQMTLPPMRFLKQENICGNTKPNTAI